MTTDYLKKSCGQTLEVNEDVANRKQRWIDGEDEEVTIQGGRNRRAGAQDRGRQRHLLEEAKAHPAGLYSRR